MVTIQQIERYFSDTLLDPAQLPRYAEIRAAAEAFCWKILDCTPQGRDQDLAIQHVRYAASMAIDAIRCREPE